MRRHLYSNQKRHLGFRIEQKALLALKALHSWECIEQNFCSYRGEIDLIFFEQSTSRLHFVEVRMRTARSYESAAASVGFLKQRNLRNCIEYYLYRHPEWKKRATGGLSIDLALWDGQTFEFRLGIQL